MSPEARPPAEPGRAVPWSINPEAAFAPCAALVLFVALSIASSNFLTSQNLVNVGTQMAILAIVSFGVTLVMVSGAFDLSVGAQVALNGCVAALVASNTGSIVLGVLAGVASGAVFGVANGLITTQLRINPFIVTLGTLVIGRGLALAITDARPVVGLPSGITSFGTGDLLGLPWLIWLMFACFAVAAFILHFTTFGLRIYARGSNEEAARLAGIRVDRTLVVAFVLSGVFAGVAAVASMARLGAGLPTTGQSLELFSVAAVVLGGSSLYGGRGAMWRTVVGVSIIAMIQNGLNLLNVEEAYQQITIGVVFILAASSELLRAGGRGSTVVRRLRRTPQRS
ncbi:MAG TPA: ABC transporter permease [Thermoleophilaceae bacterium]